MGTRALLTGLIASLLFCACGSAQDFLLPGLWKNGYGCSEWPGQPRYICLEVLAKTNGAITYAYCGWCTNPGLSPCGVWSTNRVHLRHDRLSIFFSNYRVYRENDDVGTSFRRRAVFRGRISADRQSVAGRLLVTGGLPWDPKGPFALKVTLLRLP